MPTLISSTPNVVAGDCQGKNEIISGIAASSSPFTVSRLHNRSDEYAAVCEMSDRGRAVNGDSDVANDENEATDSTELFACMQNASLTSVRSDDKRWVRHISISDVDDVEMLASEGVCSDSYVASTNLVAECRTPAHLLDTIVCVRY